MYISIAIGLFLIAMFQAFRHHDTQHEHRSFLQWVISVMSRFVRFWYAVAVGFDFGYLKYRQTLEDTPIDLENEKVLGKILKPRRRPEEPEQPTTPPFLQACPPPPPRRQPDRLTATFGFESNCGGSAS